ncbi:MAG: glycosyltransferase family 2 protein [Crenarchaeota archaeon]|nr:glycosyltransferase family 2 protein [Thermoproteota archaeon]
MTYQQILMIVLVSALTAGTFITPIFQTVLYSLGGKFKIEYRDHDIRTVFLVPVKSEPVEVIMNFFRRNRHVVSKSIATFLICDEYDTDIIESIVHRLHVEGLSENVVIFLSRSSKNKAQALNKALRAIIGERSFKIVIVDIDSVMRDTAPANCDVVSSRWRGYSRLRSLLGKGQEIGYLLFMRMLDGLYVLCGWRPTLGSGLVISSMALRDVGPFNDGVILEDVEYSIRALYRGYRISTYRNYVVDVQVPATYSALLRQQVRWAYGAGELLRKYFKYLIRRPIISLYLMQYLSYPFQLFLAIALYMCSIFHVYVPLPLQIIILLLIVYTSSIYVVWCLKDIVRESSIYSLKEPLLALNRVNMAYAVMSPRIFTSFASGVLGLPFRWIPTPKIEKLPPLRERLRMYVIEISLSVLLLSLAVLCLLMGRLFQLYMIDPVAFTITYLWGTFRAVERELT